MNKFDALKMFQGWPPEWQRLCAECFIETGEDRPAVQVWTTADKIQTAGELVQRGVALPMPGDPWPFDQPKAAAKVARKQVKQKPERHCLRYSRNEVSEVDSHLKEGREPYAIAKIMYRKYPDQRTKKAWEQLGHRVKKEGFQAMMDQAVDVEYK